MCPIAWIFKFEYLFGHLSEKNVTVIGDLTKFKQPSYLIIYHNMFITAYIYGMLKSK